MRIINADELKKKMYHEAFENDVSYDERNPMARWDSGLWIRYKMFENCLENTPTIDAADRPQGEWIKKPHKVYLPRDCEPDITDYNDHQYNEEDHSIIQNWWHCNQCGYEADRWTKPTCNFCPHCGARMKGADDE